MSELCFLNDLDTVPLPNLLRLSMKNPYFPLKFLLEYLKLSSIAFLYVGMCGLYVLAYMHMCVCAYKHVYSYVCAYMYMSI